MKHWKSCLFVLPLSLALTVPAISASAAPTVKVDSRWQKVEVQDGIDAAGEAQLKAATGISRLNLKNVQDADLAKICELFPNVTEVTIYSKVLTNVAPLAKLTGLENISLNADKVSDLAPLSGLATLKSVDIKAPIASLAWMNKLTALNNISLECHDKLLSFEGLPSLPGLKKAYFVHVAPNDLTPLVTALPALEDLTLRYAKIADLAPLAKLARLKKLNLYAAKLTDFSPLAQCSALKYLDYYAAEGADFNALGKLVQVEELYGGLTKLDNISWLPQLTRLKKFRLFAEYVTDYSPLAKTNIEDLFIWSMRAPLDLGPVGQMPALKKLKLQNTQDGKGSKALSGLAKLEELILQDGYNAKAGEKFDFSGSGWTSLKKLMVYGTPLTPEQIAAMKKLPALQSLRVDKKSASADALQGFGPNVKVQQ